MAEGTGLTVRLTDWDDEAGAELRARQMKEILSDIEGEEEDGTAPSAADIEIFILLELDSVAVACAGLRTIPSAFEPSGSAAEVKRMFVVPEQRGSRMGVTARLMKEVEAEALRRGYTTLMLATGTRMHRANAFYEKHGFAQVPLFGHYVGTGSTICYAKELN